MSWKGRSEEEAIVLSLNSKLRHQDWRGLERSLSLQKDQADGGAAGGDGEAEERASATSCDVYNSISPGVPFPRIPCPCFQGLARISLWRSKSLLKLNISKLSFLPQRAFSSSCVSYSS